MSDLRWENAITEKIVQFLTEIGLEVRRGEAGPGTFLPGIKIDHGTIVIEEAMLKYPGDLLHEAGHLAVTPAKLRKARHLSVGKSAGEEMMAIAWSYAALVHLGLEPAVVFHADGYRGGSQAIIENFSAGRYIGVPTLQWIGLTAEKKTAREQGIDPFPHMIRWVRD